MFTVIPFRAGGKTRLPRPLRRELALAMLGDVVEAGLGLGGVRLVTADVEAGDTARTLGVELVADPGGGQGAAVVAGLEGLAGPCLVVNADLPCATSDALLQLAGHGAALVAAADGTTNALSLPGASWFADCYGKGSAERFAALGLAGVSVPELERDVDTLADLNGLTLPLGRQTTLVVNHHKLASPA